MVYTQRMSTARRAIAIAGLIVLIVSLTLLVLSHVPLDRQTDRHPIAPDDLALPPPQSALPPMAALVFAAHPRRRTNAITALAVAALLLTACGAGATGGAPTPASTQPPQATEPVVATPQGPVVGVPRPHEERIVELDYPLAIRAGNSDVIRLALVLSPDAAYFTPTAESGDHTSSGDPILIPNLYDTHTLVAVARLDAIGLQIDRPGDWEQPLLPGEDVVWRWTIATEDVGRQRANIILRIRFIPKAGGETVEKEVWARTLNIDITTVFGMSGAQAQTIGWVGTLIGSVLGFPFFDRLLEWAWNKLIKSGKKKRSRGD